MPDPPEDSGLDSEKINKQIEEAAIRHSEKLAREQAERERILIREQQERERREREREE